MARDCHCLGAVEHFLRLGVFAIFDVDFGKRKARIEPVPLVDEVFHFVGFLVFGVRLFHLALLAIDVAEIAMAERYAKVRLSYKVHFERFAVVCPSGVDLLIFLEYRAYVGIVDGLSERAAECLLALERNSEYRVGGGIVVEA